MIIAEFVVVNIDSCSKCARGELGGLHARPVMHVCDAMSKYTCDVAVACDDDWCDAKSAMKLMLLEATTRSRLKVRLDGQDEEQAKEDLADLLLYRLGEEICPDFVSFRDTYAESRGISAESYGQLPASELLQAYAKELGHDRECKHGKRPPKEIA